MIELKNFHMGNKDIANDFLEYIAKSLNITIKIYDNEELNTFNTNFLIKMCDFDDVCSADRNRLIQI